VPIEGHLRHFARFATARGDTHVVASNRDRLATMAPSEAQRHYRLQTVARLARFLAAEDPRHEIPPGGVFHGSRPRPIPYIFSDDEIRQLLVHARRLGPPGSLRPQTYSTWFGLLAVTGMRVAEALALQLTEVTVDGLLIRHTKFKKSRLLPLHCDDACGTRPLSPPAPHRVRRDACVPLRLASARPTLADRGDADVSPGAHGRWECPCPGHRRPRLIDLRHTFAVRTLEEAPETRDRIGRHMLALTTYMATPCVASTYWSLASTPT